VKICLVHGSFFETIDTEQLIAQAFQQVLEERLQVTSGLLSDELKQEIISLFSNQQSFSRVRDVDNASVKLRFRVMTEVKTQANILNTKQYPDIRENTINLVLPCHDNQAEERIRSRLQLVFDCNELRSLHNLKIKHHFNGYFFILQSDLTD